MNIFKQYNVTLLVPSASISTHTLLIICTVTLYYIYHCKLLAVWKQNQMYNTSDKGIYSGYLILFAAAELGLFLVKCLENQLIGETQFNEASL